MIKARQALSSLTPYKPGLPKSAVGRRNLINLAANENPFGPSPRALQALQEAAQGIARYPEMWNSSLRQTLANYYGLDESQFIFGNGTDQVLKMVAESYLEPGQEIVCPDPTFSQYKHNALLMGATVQEIPLDAGGAHQLDRMRAAIGPRTQLVYLCSPNNPTGTIIPFKELASFVASVPAHVMVVIDEAYGEYVTNPAWQSAVQLLKEGHEILVLRTFSKIYGLAGLRIGYGIGSAERIAEIMRVREPFSVNRLAEVAAVAAVADQAYVDWVRQQTTEGKTTLERGLQALGLQFYPSSANFLLVQWPGSSVEVCNQLAERGILIRDGAPFGLGGAIRITVGRAEENRALLDALGQILKEETAHGTHARP